MIAVLNAKKAAMKADGEFSKEEEEGFAVELEDLTKFAATVLPGGGPSGFDLTRKMCARTYHVHSNPAWSLIGRSILREAEDVNLGPGIDEKLFKVEARSALPISLVFACSWSHQH
jgi:hypothetical protein